MRLLRCITVLLLCLVTAPAVAQPRTVYQAKEELHLHYPEYDTAAINTKIRIAMNLEQAAPDSAAGILQEALMTSREVQYMYGVSRSLSCLGIVYAHTGRYAESIALLKESALYAVRTAEGKRRLPFIYKDIGGVLILLGDYEQAITYLYQAAMLAEKSPPSAETGSIYNNIAGALMTLPQPYRSASTHKGLYYLELAERYARRINNPAQLTTALMNKGGYYLQQKEWERSLEYLHAALVMARRLDLTEREHNILLMLGEVYLFRQNPEQALPYLLEARSLKGRINPYYRIRAAEHLGEAYYALKYYDRAAMLLKEAAKTSEMLNLKSNLPEINHTLAEIYQARKQYPEALFHYQAYMQQKDSITGQEAVRNINQLEVKYRTARMDKELTRNQLLISRQENRLRAKNIWIGSISAGALLVCLCLIGLHRIHQHKRRLQDEKIHSLQQEQEINQLKAVMQGEEKERTRLARELHDGIGGLLTAVKINYAILGKENIRLPETDTYHHVLLMLDDIGREVRKTAHNLMPEVLLRNSLPEAIRLYCDQIRNGNGLKVDIQTYGPFEILKHEFSLAVYRIAQELIQNVVKHARATHVIVQLLLHEPILNMTIEDNGRGFDPEEQGEGMGLQGLRARIKSLNGNMSLESVPGKGTTVYVEFELKNPKLATG